MSDNGLRYFVTLKHGNTQRHCWVDKKVEVGNLVTLKGLDDPDDKPDTQWRVMFVSSDIRHKSNLPGGAWNVGGL